MPERTLKGTTPVFILRDNVGPADLVDVDKALDSVVFAPHCRRDGVLRVPAGWVYVGEAEVTLRLIDDKALVASKVDALRAEATQLQAETEAKLVEITRKINTLLAIEHQPSGVAS
jgi:hypothetical protein